METKLVLFGLWTALMLIYLLGDVIRIFAGDYEKGKMNGKKVTQGMWMLVACIMVLPILMIIATLTLPQSISQPTNVVVASALFLFNVFSVWGYPGYYDRFLLIISLGINVATVWYALTW